MISTTLISIAALIFIAYNGILYYTLTDLSEKVNLIEKKLEDSVQALKKAQEENLKAVKTSQDRQDVIISSRVESLQRRQAEISTDLYNKMKGFKENFMNNY
jgi:archaellum component FlaF (FlaF/FlaG flagellin family)